MIWVSIPKVFVVKKDAQSYTITPNKNKSNMTANAYEGFGISTSILRFYGRDEIMVFTIRQFRGTKFSILSIVLIYVTPWIALLMRKYFFVSIP